MPFTSRTAVRALLVCAVAGLSVTASASDRLAVLEVTGSAVGEDMRRAITDRARAAALDPARRAGLAVMTRESTALVIQQMGGQCLDGQCEIEIAKTIGAAFVVTGEVRKLEGAYFSDLKLHDTDKGTLLAVEAYQAKDPLDLLDQTAGAADRLVAAGLAAAVGTEGTIDLDVVDAGARVLLDGREVARGPVRKSLSSPVGTRRVVVDLEGHATWESSVDVRPRSTTVVAPRLVPLTGASSAAPLAAAGSRTYVGPKTYVEIGGSGVLTVNQPLNFEPGFGLGYGVRVGRRLRATWAVEFAVARLDDFRQGDIDDEEFFTGSVSAGAAAAWSPTGGRWLWIAAEGGVVDTEYRYRYGVREAKFNSSSLYGSGELRLDLPLHKGLSFGIRTGILARPVGMTDDNRSYLATVSPTIFVGSSSFMWAYGRVALRLAF
jgi:hypothetical protein